MADVTTIQMATEVVNSTSLFITAIKDFIINLITGAASVIAASAVIAKYLPPPEESGFFAWVHRIINKLGQNAGFAANKEIER